jgi:hypothetical protein
LKPQKRDLSVARPNVFGLWIILTVAFAGFQHFPWWAPTLAAVVGFAWYQFDKASIGIAQIIGNGGGLLGGIWYVSNLVFLYGIAWLVGYGLSLAF